MQVARSYGSFFHSSLALYIRDRGWETAFYSPRSLCRVPSAGRHEVQNRKRRWIKQHFHSPRLGRDLPHAVPAKQFLLHYCVSLLVLPLRIFSKILSGKIKMPLVQIISQIPSTLGEVGRNLSPKARANVRWADSVPSRIFFRYHYNHCRSSACRATTFDKPYYAQISRYVKKCMTICDFLYMLQRAGRMRNKLVCSDPRMVASTLNDPFVSKVPRDVTNKRLIPSRCNESRVVGNSLVSLQRLEGYYKTTTACSI